MKSRFYTGKGAKGSKRARSTNLYDNHEKRESSYASHRVGPE